MTSLITLPSFNATAEAIGEALSAFDRQASATSDAIAVVCNAYVDSLRKSKAAKDELGIEAVKREVRDCQVMVDLEAQGLLSAGTVRAYAIGIARAFYHGAVWTPSAFKSEDKGGLPNFPWADKGKAAPKGKTVAAAAKAADKADKGAVTVNAPAGAEEARAYMVQALNTLQAYANKHAKVLDLVTRDVAAQCGRLADTLKKVDAAPF